jgi:methyl-accepting chemotaxis protein
LAGDRADLCARPRIASGGLAGDLAHAAARFADRVRSMVTDTREMSVGIAVGATRTDNLMRGTAGSARRQGELTDVIFNASNEVTAAMGTVSGHARAMADATGGIC